MIAYILQKRVLFVFEELFANYTCTEKCFSTDPLNSSRTAAEQASWWTKSRDTKLSIGPGIPI